MKTDRKSYPLSLNPMTVPTLLIMIVAFLLLAPQLVRLPYRIVINYNEGWNAYFALRALEWKNIYDSGNALIQNNYPPLSFYVVGAVARLARDELMAGRWVALMAFSLTCFNIYLAITSTTRARAASLFGALFFAAFMAAYCEDYIGMNDPQMLAHALMTTALVMVVRGDDGSRLWMGAPVLMILAAMIKHNLVAFPLAATVFMALQGRRPLLRWLSFSLGLAILSGLLVFSLYGSSFFVSVLTSREFSTSKILEGLMEQLPYLLPPLAVWGLGAFSAPRTLRRSDQLIMLYLVFSATTGFYFYGGHGVNVNVLFDLFIALSWGAGMGLARLDASASRTPHRFPGALWIASLFLILDVLVPFPSKMLRWKNLLGGLAALEFETMADVEYLRSVPGPVLCTTLVLSYWAGKPFEYDPYNTWQAVQMGRMHEEEVFRRLRNHSYGVVQLESLSVGASEDFRTRLLREVEQYYELDRQSVYGYFFVPRGHRDLQAG